LAVWGCGPVGQRHQKCVPLRCGRHRTGAPCLAQTSGAATMDLRRGHSRNDQWPWCERLHRCRRLWAEHRLGFDAVVNRIKVATLMEPTVPLFSGRRSTAVVISGPSRSLACTAVRSTRSPSDPPSTVTVRMAQTPVQHYLPQLLDRIEMGAIDLSLVITHPATLEGLEHYKTFRAKQDGCIKAVMKP